MKKNKISTLVMGFVMMALVLPLSAADKNTANLKKEIRGIAKQEIKGAYSELNNRLSDKPLDYLSKTDNKYTGKKDYKFNCEYAGINEKIAELWFDSQTISPSEFVQVITEIRKWKLPDWHEIGTAWSFFKNPVIPVEQRSDLQKKFPELKWFEVEEWIKLSAWQLIDICGFKWKWNWKVWTYKTHALILINQWNATWTDVL